MAPVEVSFTAPEAIRAMMALGRYADWLRDRHAQAMRDGDVRATARFADCIADAEGAVAAVQAGIAKASRPPVAAPEGVGA